MGLESFTYITSLNASNPIHATDQVSQGDDHLRGLKTVLLNSFAAIAGAVTSSHTELNYLDGVTGVTGTGNLALSASPTFTGTLTAAAIAATTYDGIAAANLVDKSAAETISGTWGFAAITATTYDGIAAANLVDKSAAETISGTWGFAAITATTYDGIAATNLLDETAAIDSSVANTSAKQPGYKGAPQLTKSASYTLALVDMGFQVYLNGGSGQTLTIPANASVAFPIGTIIEVINDSGNDWTIAITTDTLEQFGGSTGSKTLGDNNKAILEKVTSTLWKYSATD